MLNYYLNSNAQSNGDHEVHKETCPYYYNYKIGGNFIYIGTFFNEQEAVKQAKKLYPVYKIDGCAHCCPNAHRS